MLEAKDMVWTSPEVVNELVCLCHLCHCHLVSVSLPPPVCAPDPRTVPARGGNSNRRQQLIVCFRFLYHVSIAALPNAVRLASPRRAK